MATKTVEKIIKTVHEIPEDRHGELLDLVKEFKKKGVGAGKAGKWDRFIGILSDEDADAMLAVIEEECERIDHD